MDRKNQEPKSPTSPSFQRLKLEDANSSRIRFSQTEDKRGGDMSSLGRSSEYSSQGFMNKNKATFMKNDSMRSLGLSLDNSLL